MDKNLKRFEIREIQGDSLTSPMAGAMVRIRGVVTGVLRQGFYIQTPNVEWDTQQSDAIFVYSRSWLPEIDDYLEVSGEVTDYLKHDLAKPVTQLHMDQARLINKYDEQGQVMRVEPLELTHAMLDLANDELARLLNSLEGMLLEIPAGQTFIAPSNPHGDYVLALDKDASLAALRSAGGGVLISKDNPLQWYPGFRVYNYNHAQRLNVGSKLTSRVRGPLHYRVDAWQIAVNEPFSVDPAFVEHVASTLEPIPGSMTVMTLNCFNLDPHIESADKVMNPAQDIDDDWGEGRFHTLAQAVVLQARCPDVIALQEIQDNDGAEQTDVVAADETYRLLVRTISQLSEVNYQWVNIDPESGADGGQPGGNIRNGFLYNPERVELIPESVHLLGRDHEAFEGSRKPLVASFKERHSSKTLACINVHLASKRHQNSIFSPIDPGEDAKLPVRVEQARIVAQEARRLLDTGVEFYVTGDFNDTEHSDTLSVLENDFAHNLVMLLPNHERYDYNHRGKLQVLMHGLVSRRLAAEHAEYQIIHGNELIGVQPGEESNKPSDHAYVIARLNLQE